MQADQARQTPDWLVRGCDVYSAKSVCFQFWFVPFLVSSLYVFSASAVLRCVYSSRVTLPGLRMVFVSHALLVANIPARLGVVRAELAGRNPTINSPEAEQG